MKAKHILLQFAETPEHDFIDTSIVEYDYILNLNVFGPVAGVLTDHLLLQHPIAIGFEQHPGIVLTWRLLRREGITKLYLWLAMEARPFFSCRKKAIVHRKNFPILFY